MEATLQQYIDWEFILDTIRDGKCILVTGPEVARTPEGDNFRTTFLQELDIPNNPFIATYYEKDDFFLFKDARAKSRIYYQMKRFYQDQPFEQEIYKKIARLPIGLYINASPDRFLDQVMGQDLPHLFEYFHKNDPQPVSEDLRPGMPRIYNLVGVLEEEESLLLTHNDLYEFLEGVLSSQRLPQYLLNALYGASSLIFLGLSFEKWYVQLMLRLLRLHEDESKFVRYATDQKFNADTLSICRDQFKIEFINEDIQGFVDELFKRCEQQGILRELEGSHRSLVELVRQAIEGDDFEQAITRLKNFFKDLAEDLYTEMIGISSRYNRLKKRMNQNVLDEKEAGQELAKIRMALLDITKEMETLI